MSQVEDSGVFLKISEDVGAFDWLVPRWCNGVGGSIRFRVAGSQVCFVV